METSKKNNMKLNYNVYFDVYDVSKTYGINLNNYELLFDIKDYFDPYLKIIIDQNTFLEWLLGYEDFNMLDSGHRIKFYRKPNKYVVETYFLLSLFKI